MPHPDRGYAAPRSLGASAAVPSESTHNRLVVHADGLKGVRNKFGHVLKMGHVTCTVTSIPMSL